MTDREAKLRRRLLDDLTTFGLAAVAGNPGDLATAKRFVLETVDLIAKERELDTIDRRSKQALETGTPLSERGDGVTE